jgi:putative acetyltransferase
MLIIASETPRQAEILALLQQSDAYMASLYPAESNHMLDVGSLCAPGVHFLVARWDGRIAGCAALVRGEAGAGEIKRMFVDPAVRGKGVGRGLLERIETIARREAIHLLQLETGGKQPEALELYRRFGYLECGPFGSYKPDPHSLFMEKRLQGAPIGSEALA